MNDYEYIHYGTVKPDGKLSNQITFEKEISFFSGLMVEIKVRKKRSKRSNEQNRLYHSYCKLIAEYTGYSHDEIHSIIGYKFLRSEKVDEKTGEIFEYVRSTTKLNKSEFSDFIASIQEWAEVTFKLRLPVPGENWSLTFV